MLVLESGSPVVVLESESPLDVLESDSPLVVLLPSLLVASVVAWVASAAVVNVPVSATALVGDVPVGSDAELSLAVRLSSLPHATKRDAAMTPEKRSIRYRSTAPRSFQARGDERRERSRYFFLLSRRAFSAALNSSTLTDPSASVSIFANRFAARSAFSVL